MSCQVGCNDPIRISTKQNRPLLYISLVRYLGDVTGIGDVIGEAGFVLSGWLHGDRTGVAQMHASLKPGLSDSGCGWEGEQEPASQGAYEALNGIGDQV